MKTKQITKPKNWEIKDRVYYLTGNKQPIVKVIATKHTSKRPLLWFDEEKGYQRELRYATNQPSPFVDEQEGAVTLEQIAFRDGSLFVPKTRQNLQLLLSLLLVFSKVSFSAAT